MPGVLLRIVGISTGEPHGLDGRYVVEYDPKPGFYMSPGGPCHLYTSSGPEEAKVFPGMGEALEYWRQSNGVREDGKPNRPLTVFTVTFDPAPEKEGA